MRDDTDEIVRRLEDDVEGVLHKLYPGWLPRKVKSEQQAMLTPRIKKGQKKPTSSFTMNLSGSRRGQWYRFSAGMGGGVVSLFFYSKFDRLPSSKSDWADAFKEAREYLGIDQRSEASEEADRARDERRASEKADREKRIQEEEERRVAAEAERTLSAVEVWNSALPLSGSHAEAYLRARGIAPVSEWPWDPKDTLRFHPSLSHEMDPRSGRWPAFVCLVVDAFGAPTSVWQEYLDRKEAAKAPIDMPKLGRGPLNGGAIRIGGDAPRIGVAEGSLTALGLWDLEGYRKPIWATTSTSGLVGFEVPLSVEHVSIYHDGDRAQVNRITGAIVDPPGWRAATTLYERLKSTGVGTNRNEMPLLGDGLDLKVILNEHAKRIPKDRAHQ